MHDDERPMRAKSVAMDNHADGISVRANQLQDEINQLAESVEDLENRIDPFLRNEPSEAAFEGGDSEMKPDNSDVARTLERMQQTVFGIKSKVLDLTARFDA